MTPSTRLKTTRRLAGLCLTISTALLLGCSASFAGKANDTMTAVFENEVTTYDFYFQTTTEGTSLSQTLCDGLIYRDPQSMEFKGLLAESWNIISPTELDLTLRKDVKFHNGQSFTADDVVYTLNWASAPETKAINVLMTSWISKVEKLDDYKVKIRLKAPDPAMLDYLATGVPIYPAEYHKKVGSQGFSRAPVCTGPYKAETVEPGSRIVMVKNDNYFAASPKGKPQIGKIIVRYLKDHNVTMGELMTGNVDWAYQIAPDQVTFLKDQPNLQVRVAESNRMAYMMMNSSTVPDNSPTKNILVRQAMFHAINRDALVKELVGNGAVRLDTYCYPRSPGCKNGVANHAFDPAKARELLKQAGYPNGFDIDIYSSRDRFVTEALIGDLRNVGIRAKLNYMQFPAIRDRWGAGQVPLAHVTFAPYGMIESSVTLTFYFTGGVHDPGKKPEIIKEIRDGVNELDTAKRVAHYEKAVEMMAKEIYWVPLYLIPLTYVYNKDLVLEPTFDSIARFYLARWK